MNYQITVELISFLEIVQTIDNGRMVEINKGCIFLHSCELLYLSQENSFKEKHIDRNSENVISMSVTTKCFKPIVKGSVLHGMSLPNSSATCCMCDVVFSNS